MNRQASLRRKTAETDIFVQLCVDGNGEHSIQTGIGFFDHMLRLLSCHSLMDLTVKAEGDLDVDGHHTVEDIGIVLGKVFAQALGDKKGITRFATEFVAMDEALARVSVDVSARPVLVTQFPPLPPAVGGLETQLIEEFLRAFCVNAGLTLHVKVEYGENGHHIIEAAFKALARALRTAAQPDARNANRIPSSKGMLDY